ncbi:MAG: HEAT repeat domain-containing protein [Planctomycetia bacterium]|nr:HEAT repeat domain-containing protein [Planctomycetia bacterium]
MRKATLVWCVLCLVGLPVMAQEDAAPIMENDEAGLIAVIQSADASDFAKMKAAQALATKGTDAAIPALVSLLPDEKLNLYGRFGLEGIGTPACKAAMLEATETLSGRPLQGVLGSLGQMRYEMAVPALAEFVMSDDVLTVNAAAGALGRIGHDEAVEALKKSFDRAIENDLSNKNALADAMLAAAETYRPGSDDAEEIYRMVAAACMEGKLPSFFVDAVVTAAGPYYGDLQEEILRVAFMDPDVFREEEPEGSPDQSVYFDAMLALSRKCDGAFWTVRFVTELPSLPPEKQTLVLEAMRDRRMIGDLDVMAYTKSGSPEVAKAAVKLLAKFATAEAVTTLLDAAISDDPSVASVAKDGLATLTADGVDAKLAEALDGAEGAKLKVLLELVGTRGTTDAIATLLKLLDSDDVSIRIAATRALASTCGIEQLRVMISRGTKAAATEEETKVNQDALVTAAVRQADPTACAEQIAEAMNASDDNAVKSQLMTVLGKVAGGKALEIVVEASKSDDPAVVDAATRVLGEWPNVDAAPALLEIARQDEGAAFRTRALRGYIRIARQMAVRDDVRLEMFRTAMELSSRPEERQIAIEILKRIPTIDSFRASAEFFGDSDPVVKASAIDNVIGNAWKLGGEETAEIVRAAREAKAQP